MAVWQSIRQCVPALADAVLQAGLDDIGAARWACFHIEELAGSPAQLIARGDIDQVRSEEHTSELQSLMRISYAVFCLKKKNKILRNKQSLTTSNNRIILDSMYT